LYHARLTSLKLYDQRRGCICWTMGTEGFKICRKMQLSNTFQQKKRTLKYLTKYRSYEESKGFPTLRHPLLQPVPKNNGKNYFSWLWLTTAFIFCRFQDLI
jgi:hypothetical protein